MRKKVAISFLIVFFASINSHAGNLKVGLSADQKGSNGNLGIRLLVEDQVEHLGFEGEYAYCRNGEEVCRDEGSLTISSNPDISICERCGLWFSNKTEFDNVEERKENTIGGGPVYRLFGNSYISTGGVYNSQVGQESRGFYSHKAKIEWWKFKVKYLYQHNIENKRDYWNEFKFTYKRDDGLNLYHTRKKRFQSDRDLSYIVEFVIPWK